ncbi:Protein of unknown function DUF2442 (plasmid) [Deinococcus proteolyticus MRP]|uniref:Helix-turn-helix domain protein n=1 Tax=Deinococcus proteolyticus (strain ATCC 35074 / DSM 20540 / JCM 6276 / NBRC 101906 / NCIMB 13154 / VKM Ac-1939 / CCM 2703 / MRP) TaxID=693977 RepID=F0RR95_DEIPM|nr:DUF2442 domain-containing protein [Deinococcus proteolyticus]ADY27804.1 Protein of unknown function DUF2442 [Deinococcus proteolyticus MRP]
MKKITAVSAGEGYTLHLTFEDGVRVHADISRLMERPGVFAPLQDRAYFEGVRCGPRGRSVTWEDGQDLDPDVFYMEDTDPRKPTNIRTLSRTAPRANPLSEQLRELVAASGESQAEIARRAGMPQQSLSRLLDPDYTGHSWSSVERVAQALGREIKVEFQPLKTGTHS